MVYCTVAKNIVSLYCTHKNSIVLFSFKRVELEVAMSSTVIVAVYRSTAVNLSVLYVLFYKHIVLKPM